MNYTPLHIYSHYSVRRGLNSPKEIIKHCKKLGIKAAALTDINNMSGCIEFYKAAKEAGIKPIIGCNLSTNQGSLVLIALNRKGYNELLKLTAKANSPKNKGIMPFTELSKFKLDNIITITGHEDSTLYKCIAQNFKIRDDCNFHINEHLNQLFALKFKEIYLELQFSEKDALADKIKDWYKLTCDENFKLIAAPRVYYLDKTDQELHKILISVDQNESIENLNKINSPFYKFFDGYDFYLPSEEEFRARINNDKAIENTNILADKVEDYDLAHLPTLPKFITPNKEESSEYFEKLCFEALDRKVEQNIVSKDKKKVYEDRINEEIEVFKDANLFDYFLIVRDIIKYAHSKGYLLGAGRGSVGGCLTGYLFDIHQMDSIKYGLLFARFFNAGRKGSLPDIDTDFPKRSRADIIQYIVNKYGKQNVMQIATYSTLMGRAALKAVFRAYGDISFAEMNEITKNIYDKAKISDELQQMADAGEEPSVIKWHLIHKGDALSAWCSIDKDGHLHGPLAKRFEQAIKLEGVICSLSKHAAGVVIGPEPIKNLAPIVYDPKENQQIIGCQHQDLEYIGLCKMDILGISTLDRLEGVNEI